MNPEQQQAVIERLLAHLEAGSTDSGDRERQIDTSIYLDAGRFADEHETLFRRLPVALALSSALPEPGSFLTNDDYGLPLLLTRDQQGQVHVMANTCTHRGTRLVACGTGALQKAFSCPYHGWTFGNDGRLLHVNRAECFPSTEKADRGLTEFPSEERHGLIWAVLSPGGSMDLDGFLGEMGQDLADLQLDSYVTFARDTWPYAGNWKLSVEGFLEVYHAPSVHRLQADAFIDDVAVLDEAGLHQRLVVPRPSIRTLAGLDRQRWKIRRHTTIVHFLFPATFLVAQPDYFMFFRFCPDAVDRVRVVHDLLVPRVAANDACRSLWETVREQCLIVMRDDTGLFAKLYDGLRTGMLPRIQFGTLEQALMRFHDTLNRVLPSGR